MFEQINNANSEIKNLGLENIVINVANSTMYQDIGGLCDDFAGKSISNCYVSGGSFEAHYNASMGGLIGTGFAETIENCYSSVTIENTYSVNGTSGYGTDVGGIIGDVSYGFSTDIIPTIKNCYSACEIDNSNAECVGGVVGSISLDFVMSNCQFSGEIFGYYRQSYVGGLIGSTTYTDCNISNCAVDGSIQAADAISAGLIGRLNNSIYASYNNISNCYVSALGNYNYGVVAESYTKDLTLKITNTSHSQGKELYDPNNSNITSSGSWNSSYAPIFNYYATEVQTTVLQTNTSVIDATSGVYLSTLGINSGMLTLMVKGVSKELQYSSGYTLQNFIDSLKTYGITASISAGKLYVGQNSSAYIISDSGNLTNKAGLDIYNSYKLTTETLYKNISSNELSKTQVKLPAINTESNKLEYVSNYTLNESTMMADLNLGGSYQVMVNGKNVNISIKSSDNFADLINKLKNIGIDASISNGIFLLRGNGESGIHDAALISAMKLGQISYVEGEYKQNTESDKLTYFYELPWLNVDEIYAPGSFMLQVGIYSDEESQIKIETCFKLSPTEALRGIGGYDQDYLASIDKMIGEITLKQTELGAIQNRLVSALDEISIHYENLLSSRSTIRDADIAEVSSEYIRNQILQQASATLLSAANQSPSIALQLL